MDQILTTTDENRAGGFISGSSPAGRDKNVSSIEVDMEEFNRHIKHEQSIVTNNIIDEMGSNTQVILREDP